MLGGRGRLARPCRHWRPSGNLCHRPAFGVEYGADRSYNILVGPHADLSSCRPLARGQQAERCGSVACVIMQRPWGTSSSSATLAKDLRTLSQFIGVYCDRRHGGAVRAPVDLDGLGVAGLGLRRRPLCDGCSKLLTHSCVKRMRCPYRHKPSCKRCPSHCYHPTYRGQIREVMRFSGRHLVLSGRLDLLFHLLF